MVFIDLGWCIGKFNPQLNKLTIVSPSDGNDNSYTPAESVVVFGKDGLYKLRDALNMAYPVEV